MDIQNRIITGKQQDAQGRRLVSMTILRDGKEMQFDITPEVFGPEEMRVIGIGPNETFFIDELSPGMPAESAGLAIGDQPIAIDGEPILSFAQLIGFLEKTEHNQSIAFTVRKGGEDGPKKTYSISLLKETLPSVRHGHPKNYRIYPPTENRYDFSEPIHLDHATGKGHISRSPAWSVPGLMSN